MTTINFHIYETKTSWDVDLVMLVYFTLDLVFNRSFFSLLEVGISDVIGEPIVLENP